MSEQKKDDAFENMMNMYEESHKPKQSTGKKYDIKNYFSSRLEQNEKEAIKTIRILPPPEGKNTWLSSLDIEKVLKQEVPEVKEVVAVP